MRAASISRADAATLVSVRTWFPFVHEPAYPAQTDFLAEPGATVASVAGRVGYGSAFALSTAFKGQHGVSPRQHRTSVTAPAATAHAMP